MCLRTGLWWAAAVILAAACLAACRPANTPAAATNAVVLPAGMTVEQSGALNTLAQVDDYPLYTLEIKGAAAAAPPPPANEGRSPEARSWGCSLFASFADPQNMLSGRNFDWEYSPALLLFYQPPDGYTSASMVDIAYLGYDQESAQGLANEPLVNRAALLSAPFLPFDGLNEQGLVVGMAAVPDGGMAPDATKPTIGSLGLIRELLDHAANVEQALAIVERYNVDMTGGPPLHYLLADAGGHAALVEFANGELVVLKNEQPGPGEQAGSVLQPWHLATNFLVSQAGDNIQGQCPRYDRLQQRLSSGEPLAAQDALDLLMNVAQHGPNSGTQWSVVYQISTLEIRVAMGRDFEAVHAFRLVEK